MAVDIPSSSNRFYLRVPFPKKGASSSTNEEQRIGYNPIGGQMHN